MEIERNSESKTISFILHVFVWLRSKIEVTSIMMSYNDEVDFMWYFNF